jgi:NitT/TauT family transport system substrate-binding protein
LTVAAATTAALAVAGPAAAQAPEKPKVVLGVGGKTLLYYLPLTIAERRGLFKEAGLAVEINDFGGGAKSLQAMIGGSTDVTAGAYEHTIRMQAKGQDVRAVIELGRFPGIVLAARRDLAGTVRSVADLKGRKIGVTAPGSSTNFFASFLLSKAGVAPEDVAFVGVGGGQAAIAAILHRQIDALANLDPVISKLEQDNAIDILADSRTEAGNRAIFGGSNPAAVLYAKAEFIARNPNTVQALVDAFYKALRWLAAATPEDVVRTVPEQYLMGDRALYLRAVGASLPTYSRTGVVTRDGMESARAMLVQFDAELQRAAIDLDRTWDGRFVARAAQRIN